MNNKDLYLSEYRLITTAFIIVITIGTVFYHFVENISWLDSIYFCIITLATVGYGDITPKTSLGKIFTIFYVLTGIGFITFFINLLIRRAYYRRIKRQGKKVKS